MSRKSPQRGLHDIRTRPASAGTRAEPRHITHMRLCCLEMERQRKQAERAAAAKRVEQCDARCRQIEREMNELRARVDMEPDQRRLDVRTVEHQPRGTSDFQHSY